MRRIENFFWAPGDPRPLAGLRIVLGLMMMVETVSLWSFLDELYGPYGFLEAGLMNAIGGTSAPSFAQIVESNGWDYSGFLYSVFGLRWIALLTFTFGYRTRVSTVALWAFQSFIIFSGLFSSYGVDRYFHLFLFLLIWMPTGAAWSMDAYGKGWRPQPSYRYSLRVLQICLLMTYLNAGLSKSAGFEWWNGDAVWRAVHMPEFQTLSFMWMSDSPIVPKSLSLMTLFFETFYLIGAWIPGVGPLWTFVIIGMHLGIATFMSLVNFGITMALINSVLFLLPLHLEGWANSFAEARDKLARFQILVRPRRKEAPSPHGALRETRFP